MRIFTRRGAVALAVFVASFSGWDSAFAVSVPFVSGDGSESCIRGTPTGGPGAPCSLQIIDPHPAWQDPTALNDLEAYWISYGDTGYQGTELAPPIGSAANPTGTDVIVSIIETIFAPHGGTLTFNIWADDTAGVFLNNVSMFAPNFTQNICAQGTIGCQPDESGFFSWTLPSGTHEVKFELYQVGSGTTTTANPFGALYAGTFNPASHAPEPSSLILLGSGLAGLMRRFYRKRVG